MKLMRCLSFSAALNFTVVLGVITHSCSSSTLESWLLGPSSMGNVLPLGWNIHMHTHLVNEHACMPYNSILSLLKLGLGPFQVSKSVYIKKTFYYITVNIFAKSDVECSNFISNFQAWRQSLPNKPKIILINDVEESHLCHCQKKSTILNILF